MCVIERKREKKKDEDTEKLCVCQRVREKEGVRKS
jgi:hypothetical protein